MTVFFDSSVLAHENKVVTHLSQSVNQLCFIIIVSLVIFKLFKHDTPILKLSVSIFHKAAHLYYECLFFFFFCFCLLLCLEQHNLCRKHPVFIHNSKQAPGWLKQKAAVCSACYTFKPVPLFFFFPLSLCPIYGCSI